MAQAAAFLLGSSYTGLQLLGALDEHVFVCSDAEAAVLVVDWSFAEHGRELLARVSSLKHVILIDEDGGCDAWEPHNPADTVPFVSSARHDDIAWLAYTGGTTGRPKGVMQPQRSMVAQTLSALASWAMPEKPRYLAASPITHAAFYPLLPTLVRGGTVILLRAFQPEAWYDAVERQQVNWALAVPSMIYALLDTPTTRKYDTSSIETLAYGGAPMTPSRLAAAQRRFGRVFLQVYGQTETSPLATVLRRHEHDPDRPHLLASCGRAAVGKVVAVLDDDGARVPTGEVGEICINTAASMIGYKGLPNETAAVMRDGWIRSGDLGRQDEDGYFYIVDRKKDMIVSGGFNIYAREVEDVIVTHPSVSQAAVIGVPEDTWGEAVKAIIVPKSQQRCPFEEIAALVRQAKGPMYAPKTVDIVESLPLTTVGKVDKKALRARYWTADERQVH